jgi:hypothetical protein
VLSVLQRTLNTQRSTLNSKRKNPVGVGETYGVRREETLRTKCYVGPIITVLFKSAQTNAGT